MKRIFNIVTHSNNRLMTNLLLHLITIFIAQICAHRSLKVDKPVWNISTLFPDGIPAVDSTSDPSLIIRCMQREAPLDN